MELSNIIQELITCKKSIIKADKNKMVLTNRSYRNNVNLSSEDKKYLFTVFLRCSEEFAEDFSIGLTWTNPNEYISVNKNIILFRCQGPHDGKQPFEIDCHHSFHTHEITPNDINEKRYTRPSNRTVIEKFKSFDEAIVYFSIKCGIINLDEYIEINTMEAIQISWE